ncbi:serine hydrolase domain-containing protein [Streptomyces sp. NPDC004111]|uniref:serine hydrolase domain-containing protein n=1 Tax=Streptomyces sp. NPDC004111 TaxID=3364690 RepID=UPI0036B79F47
MAVRRTMRTGAMGLAAALAVTAFAQPAFAETRGAEQSAGQNSRSAGQHAATQRAMEEMVAAGSPGLVAEAIDDQVWKGTAGVGDRRTGKPRGADDRFRIGSITKTFVATVLLQLEAEGRLDLDDTVDRWLPGMVRGNGNDGRTITVRQLLNHTSGLYNYTNDAAFTDRNLLGGFLKHRFETHTPRELVRVALRHKPDFAPGARHSYSNTGYILAGLIIEKVTGKSYEQAVRERVINRLGLRQTSLPGTNPFMPAKSSRAYSKLTRDPAATKIYDATEHNMSWGWSAGDMISTTSDLNRFFTALMRGKLMPAKQLAEMRTAVPAPDNPVYSGYGLGLYNVRTSCGANLWGHSGGTVGSNSETAITPDGRHTISYNRNGDWGPLLVVEAEFCGNDKAKSDKAKSGMTKSEGAQSGKSEPGAVNRVPVFG